MSGLLLPKPSQPAPIRPAPPSVAPRNTPVKRALSVQDSIAARKFQMTEPINDLLAHYPATRKTGEEYFHLAGQPRVTTLRDFWQWSVSDVISNATRGRLAEFIVADALGLAGNVRNEWGRLRS